MGEQLVEVVDQERVDDVPVGIPPMRRRRGALLLAALVGVLALVCAAALPLAPVRMSVPQVSWPLDPRSPAPTMLELTNQTPSDLDVRFSCAAVRAAAGTADGVVVATLVPGRADANAGLVVTARDGRLRIADRGRTALAETPPSGECTYRVHAVAGSLVVERDGAVVGELRGPHVLPDVDVLTTSIRALPGADDLGVRITVDDQFDTTPTAVKKVLVAVLLLAAIG